MFLQHFDVLCDLLLNRRTTIWNLFVLYNKETNYYSFFVIKDVNTAFLFQNLSQLLESRLFPLRRKRKKPFDVICCLYKMKQSHWLPYVASN